MTLADNQQQRLLERLRQAGEQPLDFAELHAGGIDFPAAVVCELGLNGYTAERVYDNCAWSAQSPPKRPPHTAAARGRTGSQPLCTPRSPQIARL
jgi:hypothetical protein